MSYMCGIAGFLGFNYGGGEAKETAQKMQAALQRRKGNKRGIHISPSAVLVHTRRHTTLRHNGQKMTVVWSGELYNTDEVRKELFRADHTFTGTDDAEVVLHAFAEWGGACVERFNGVFAFAVLNETTGRLFMARDRIGIKPFFYYFDKGQLVFGSALPAVLAHPAVPHIVDKSGVLEIVLLGPGRTIENGIFKNVFALPPACTATVDISNPQINIKQYWHLTEKPYLSSYAAAVAEIRHLTEDAIRRQLKTDAASAQSPVGTLLSGGIDSSIISAVVRRHVEKLQTFSVDYAGNDRFFRPTKFQPNDDRHYIAVMNHHLSSAGNKSVINTAELLQSLYRAADMRALPGMADVDGSLLLFCRDIKRRVPVAVSGECADEIFGGYPWYYDPAIRDNAGFPWSQNTEFRASFLKDRFLRNTDPHAFVHGKYTKTVAQAPANDRHKQLMRLNLDWFMQTLLERNDRMGAACGLTVRVPFADYRLVELAYNLPWEFKFRNGVEKSILRDAFADMLPAEIVQRKKSPYPKTHNPEYLAAVSKILRDITDDETEPIHQIIKKSALKKLLSNPAPQNWYGQLMTQPQTIAYFIQINYWLKKFAVKII